MLFAVAVIGLGSLLVTGAWWLEAVLPIVGIANRRGRSCWRARPKRPQNALRAPLPSIVGLPFINLSGDTKQDYVADGITDSLTSDLARALPGIWVLSRDTAFS